MRRHGVVLTACVLVGAAACSSTSEAGGSTSTVSAPATSTTSVVDDRGGVPEGYPLDVDVVAPLVIRTVGADPIPVTGTDGKVHVAYELELLNVSPRAITIDRIDTLADGAEGAVVATIGPDEVLDRSVLVADFGRVPFTEIPAGRTALVLLDDVYDTRADVPDRSTHRIDATLGAPAAPELEQVAARYPDTVSQIGGAVRASDQQPVVLGPPVAGDGWVAANGCCGRSSHRGAMMAVGGRINGAERFAIDFLRLDTSADPVVTFHGDGTSNEDYLAYGEPLLAVADATVVSVVSETADSTPQVAPTDLRFEQLGGSYVILDIGGGNFVYYAHLIQGSATVQVGDRVSRGQVIARLGNSGNSTEAHLHLHVTRAGLPLTADNVPYVFDRFTFVGSMAGDDIEPGPDAGERTEQLPLEGSVVDFPAAP
jgi:murein DD-endopeptidase MepM/ murein hydrolase activator NlpD